MVSTAKPHGEKVRPIAWLAGFGVMVHRHCPHGRQLARWSGYGLLTAVGCVSPSRGANSARTITETAVSMGRIGRLERGSQGGCVAGQYRILRTLSHDQGLQNLRPPNPLKRLYNREERGGFSHYYYGGVCPLTVFSCRGGGSRVCALGSIAELIALCANFGILSFEYKGLLLHCAAMS